MIKKQKSILILLLVIGMFFGSILPQNLVYAADTSDVFTANITVGDNKNVPCTFKIIDSEKKFVQIGDGSNPINTAISTDSVGNLVIPEKISYDGTEYTVTKIGFGAFYGCIGLTSTGLEANNTVTTIEARAFSGCTGLTSTGLEKNTSVETIGQSVFASCIGLKSTGLETNNTVTIIGYMTFNGCIGLTSTGLETNTTLTTIEADAFSGCTGLTSTGLATNNTVTTLEWYAFENCTGLKSTGLETNTSVTKIGSSAFARCTGLTSTGLATNNTVTTLEWHAFENCTGLTSTGLETNTSVTTIAGDVFSHCTGLTSTGLETNNTVTSLGDSVFRSCTNIKEIDLNISSFTSGIQSSALAHLHPDTILYVRYPWNDGEIVTLDISGKNSTFSLSNGRIRYLAPTGLISGSNQIIGTTTDMEYKAVDSDVWKTCDNSQTNVSPGTYLVRIKSDYTNGYESKTTEVTVPAIYYDVNISTNGNGKIEANNTAAEGEDFLFTVIPDTGYEVEWVKVNGQVVALNADGKYTVTNVTANTTIEASFRKIVINVVVNPVQNGTVNLDATNFEYGQDVSFTVIPDTGYEVEWVKVNGQVVALNVDGKYTVTNVTANTTIEASFRKIVINVVVNPVQNGTVNLDATNVEYGQDVSFTVTPNKGYEVEWVKVNGEVVTLNADGKYTVANVTANTTIEASFKLESIKVDVVGTFKYSDGSSTSGLVVAIFSDPISGVVNSDGSFTLKDVPTGVHTIRVFNNQAELDQYISDMKQGITSSIVPIVEIKDVIVSINENNEGIIVIDGVVYSEINITVQNNSDGTTTPQIGGTVVEVPSTNVPSTNGSSTEVPETGDNTSVFAIMIVMTFALLGLVVTKRREV